MTRQTGHQLRKGQVVTARIASLAAGGEGVAREAGIPIFIHRVAPGDLVEIELFDVRKDFARGRAVQIIETSEQRVSPPCKLFKVCGGCQLQHLNYEWQLKHKQDILQQAVKRLGGLNPDMVRPALPASLPFHYRNKVQFPVANPHESTRILAGYYKQDSHELVNVKHCPIQPEPLDRMLSCLKEMCEQAGLKAYDEVKRAGLLRHITARYSSFANQVLVTLVINAQQERFNWQGLTEPAHEVMRTVPEIVGVCLNFNPQAGNRIFGDETICLAGAEFIVERLRSPALSSGGAGGKSMDFRLSPTSFFQVHSEQATLLLDLVAEEVGKVPLVVDAYAGVGSMALWMAAACGQVIAVEESPSAVIDGRMNCQINNIANVDFREGKVEKILPELAQSGARPDALVLDPPRKGVSPEALNSVISLNPRKILYVSCNPATLARDLKILERNGYKTRDIQPIDMFPQTFHIESVAVLTQPVED